jgi:Raf kinase inhibitor-like YbhB/YbcL family protein
MQLYSPAFNPGTAIPEIHTCLGKNISPPLVIEDVPEGTVSFVLIIEDSDAVPAPWTHWMLFDIPGSVRLIHSGHIPEGAVEGLANNHSFGYEGPCPKYFSGTHHYLFRLYALNGMLGMHKHSEKEDVEKEMKNKIIAEAYLVGLCISAEQ